MAISGRIWMPTASPFGGGTCTTATGTCPSACYNAVNPTAGTAVSLLAGLEVSSCAEAIRYYAAQLRRRLGARRIITQSASNASFTWTVKRTRRPDTIITVRPAGGCNYPVSIDYDDGAGNTAETVRFQAMCNALDWLVEDLA